MCSFAPPRRPQRVATPPLEFRAARRALPLLPEARAAELPTAVEPRRPTVAHPPPSLDVPHCDGSTSQAARHLPSLHNRPLTHVMTEQASTHCPPTYVVVRIRIPEVVHDVIGMGRRRDLVRVGLRREVRPPADEHRLGRLRSGGRRDGQHRRRHCGSAQEGRELRSHAHHDTATGDCPVRGHRPHPHARASQ